MKPSPSGRRNAKRVLAGCTVVFLYIVTTGQLTYQLEGIPILFSRILSSRFLPAQKTAEDFRREEMKRLIEREDARADAYQQRLRRWRQWNRSFGYY